MNKHFLGDTTVLLGRSLRHILRSPDTIITTAVMPIAFMLLFVYVFGGAIETGTNSQYRLSRHRPARRAEAGSPAC